MPNTDSPPFPVACDAEEVNGILPILPLSHAVQRALGGPLAYHAVTIRTGALWPPAAPRNLGKTVCGGGGGGCAEAGLLLTAAIA
ncbi:MAG: hypothetical protein BJ554DRAFT_7185 [Olpidium bornovanus]|uniref:Uncharacterized protein n=1 Tax=Olpidium bornovanus TaxID=278681 RepID=A0A8H7ZXB3_9FUNG|nr:MAG: hypothetical protein BJ554DRAFT_7185 [Olpidium bornovanus]